MKLKLTWMGNNVTWLSEAEIAVESTEAGEEFIEAAAEEIVEESTEAIIAETNTDETFEPIIEETSEADPVVEVVSEECAI